MAWYIVKSGGSATGDGGRVTSQPTGSFATRGAANYYDSIVDALAATTSPAADDYIICSDSHSKAYGSSTTYTSSGTGIGTNPILIISVSDTNMDQESAGAVESVAASADITFVGNINTKSMKFSTGDDTFLVGSTNANRAVNAFNTEFNFTGSGDRFNLSTDGTVVGLYDCDATWDVDTTASAFYMSGPTRLTMVGGSIAATTGNVDSLLDGGGSNGGFSARFTGVDLSDIDGTLFKNMGANSGDDNIDVVIEGCQLHASVAFKNETFGQDGHRLLVTNSSSSSAAAEYQYYLATVWGTVEDQDDSGIHRNESTAFDGGEKVSLKVTTSARCTPGHPFIFEVPSRFAALSNASTDTLRLYFASTTSLTDQNFWVQVYAPDGTNKNAYNTYSGRNSDFFATGTAHTDDSGSSTWKDGASDLVGYNEYRVDVDTSSDAAADSVPRVFICVAEPSATIYIDSEIDVVA